MPHFTVSFSSLASNNRSPLPLLAFSQVVTVNALATAFHSPMDDGDGHMVFRNVHFEIPLGSSAFFGGSSLLFQRDEVNTQHSEI